MTEDEEESAQARLKTKWAALEKIVGSDSHLKKIAADFVTHFEERLATMEGKAMIVCMSREICVRLHDEIIALRPEWNGSDPNLDFIHLRGVAERIRQTFQQCTIYFYAISVKT